MTLFDRYLLKRFLYVFAIGFVATYGLFVVFDAFSTADEFQNRSGTLENHVVLLRMAAHYTIQSFAFLDLVGAILIVLAVMAVFALLQRQSEIYPILSAGIPTWRLAVPILVGAMGIILLMTINQELIIPRLADRLQAPRGSHESALEIQTTRDLVRNIQISGSHLFLDAREIQDAEFLLPVPSLVSEPATLRSRSAIQVPPGENRPAGWLLKDVEPAFESLALTPQGQQNIFRSPDGNDIFVATDVTVDQLYNRSASYKYLSTAALVRRIQNPVLGRASIRSQKKHLHERLTKPLLILISVLVTVPLTLRRESRSVLMNLATCAGVLGLLFVLAQSAIYLERLSGVSFDLAAWIPVVVSGACSAWLSGLVQT
ncbi:LptF/LptG family permease [bacterium]|nr:LptF/LptG family permease [bacterium]